MGTGGLRAYSLLHSDKVNRRSAKLMRAQNLLNAHQPPKAHRRVLAAGLCCVIIVVIMLVNLCCLLINLFRFVIYVISFFLTEVCCIKAERCYNFTEDSFNFMVVNYKLMDTNFIKAERYYTFADYCFNFV